MEVDLLERIDLSKGFSLYHLQCPINVDTRFGFETWVSLPKERPIDSKFGGDSWIGTRPKGSAADVMFTWELTIDATGKIPAISFELVKPQLRHPMPLLYRLILYKEDADEVRLHRCGTVIFPLGFRHQRVSHTFDIDRETRQFKDFGLSLHLLLAIPKAIKLNAPIAPVPWLRFDIANENGSTNAFLASFARLFEMVVKHGNESDETEAFDQCCPSDVILKVINRTNKAERLFYCHQLTLSLRSPYMRKILRSGIEMAIDENGSKIPVVKIDDVDESGVEACLRYIYTGCLIAESQPSSVSEQEKFLRIAMAASKFHLHDVLQHAVSILIFRFTTDHDRLIQLPVAVRLATRHLESICMQQLSTAMLLRLEIDWDDHLPPFLRQKISNAMDRERFGYGAKIETVKDDVE